VNIVFAAVKSRDAVRRFVDHYDNGKYPTWQAKADQLAKLSVEDHTPDRIAAIIGNKGWTHPSCCECNQDVEVAITFGSGDYPATVCLPCLKGSVAALEAAQGAMKSLFPAATPEQSQ
jgi:hypothetical protein